MEIAICLSKDFIPQRVFQKSFCNMFYNIQGICDLLNTIQGTHNRDIFMSSMGCLMCLFR